MAGKLLPSTRLNRLQCALYFGLVNLSEISYLQSLCCFLYHGEEAPPPFLSVHIVDQPLSKPRPFQYTLYFAPVNSLQDLLLAHYISFILSWRRSSSPLASHAPFSTFKTLVLSNYPRFLSLFLSFAVSFPSS